MCGCEGGKGKKGRQRVTCTPYEVTVALSFHFSHSVSTPRCSAMFRRQFLFGNGSSTQRVTNTFFVLRNIADTQKEDKAKLQHISLCARVKYCSATLNILVSSFYPNLFGLLSLFLLHSIHFPASCYLATSMCRSKRCIILRGALKPGNKENLRVSVFAHT